MVPSNGFKEMLDQAAGRARETRRAVLVSHCTQAGPVDPLSFLAGSGAKTIGERVYWAEPAKEIILAGAGAACRIEAQAGNRFACVEEKWKALLEGAILPASFAGAGTGPVLFGGFSFDPWKPKTNLWRNFPDSGLIVPKYLLTVKPGKTWWTINAIVEPDAEPDELFRQIMADLERLFPPEPLRMSDTHLSSLSCREIAIEQWMELVGQLAGEIRAGVFDKVVLAREMRVESAFPILPVDVLARLTEQQPLSYVFAVERGDQCFVGASPERLVKRQGNTFLSTCLAGSIGRGNTLAADRRLGEQLLSDAKNLREHEVVVEMIKQAMSTACLHVQASDKPGLYKVRDIQHLYTPVRGQAREGVSILSLVEQLHPTPALGGYPRDIAVRKIRECELLDRGWYGAPVGWLDASGDGEFAVAIRSGLLDGKEACLFAGCGIVGGSDPVAEYNETQLKFKPMVSAIGGNGHDW